MKKLIALAVVCCSTFAFAQAAQEGVDMTKVGPAARKPKNEAAIKKEIMAFFKKADEAKDFDSMVALHDFPVFMITDDANGNVEAKLFTRDEYVEMMKPMMEHMPKDMKVTHKPTITVLSDNMANVTDAYTMTIGKQKVSGKNSGFLVKKNGQWLWKTMEEAGWGGMGHGDSAATGGAGAETK
ncbi:MAG: hypothetical protein IRZ16_10565 [Myxococcaceae bacterium]|nr:hypothetical protein [Myxococcaceae bacterium]